ncbi:MAG: hypothetical protein QOF58_4151 [Pseudonocardiales bacterium]|nr:hypothetical protein [Pseudonocardiales bacterium]
MLLAPEDHRIRHGKVEPSRCEPNQLAVTYQLDVHNRLSVGYRAETDAPTVLNLTNHTYTSNGRHAPRHNTGPRQPSGRSDDSEE